MSVRPIIYAPDPVLKRVSEPIPEVNAETRALLDDMVETMYDAQGIGLAAIQIGVPKRAIVMDLSGDDTSRKARHFINPEITWLSEDTQPYEEGCLSIPEIYDTVERPSAVRFRYTDYEGAEQEEEATGLFAVCIQHEIDHLNGVLFIDHLSKLKRSMLLRKLNKILRSRQS